MQLWSSQHQWDHMMIKDEKKRDLSADGGGDGAGEKDEREEEHASYMQSVV